MFANEVIVSVEDKEKLVQLLTEADKILNKYPYFSKPNCHTVTTISRAKGFVSDAKKWCGYLHTDPNEKID